MRVFVVILQTVEDCVMGQTLLVFEVELVLAPKAAVSVVDEAVGDVSFLTSLSD